MTLSSEAYPAAAKVPRVGDLFAPTVLALRRLGGSGSNEEITEAVAEVMNLPQAARDEMWKDGRRTKLDYRVAWAKSWLKMGGFADNSERGVWSLTPAGRALSEKELHDLPKRLRAIAQSQRRARQEAEPDAGEDADSPLPEVDWADRLLGILLSIPPDAFERLCQRVLREAGFTKVEVTGRSGDGGIDGNGILRVKLVSFQVLFQAKRWKGAVGPSVVRDFRGAMVGRADKGLIITTGTFTADARREATRDGAPAIDLVDGEDLCNLLKELKIGVTIRQVEQVEVDERVFSEV